MMRCGLLGEKLGHSYSPAIHAQLADYAYGLYEVAPEAPAGGESAQEEFMQPEPGKNGGLAKKLIAAAVVLFLITTGSITALYLNQNKQASNQDALPLSLIHI